MLYMELSFILKRRGKFDLVHLTHPISAVRNQWSIVCSMKMRAKIVKNTTFLKIKIYYPNFSMNSGNRVYLSLIPQFCRIILYLKVTHFLNQPNRIILYFLDNFSYTNLIQYNAAQWDSWTWCIDKCVHSCFGRGNKNESFSTILLRKILSYLSFSKFRVAAASLLEKNVKPLFCCSTTSMSYFLSKYLTRLAFGKRRKTCLVDKGTRLQ